MTSQSVRRGEAPAALAREIAAVEDEYRMTLQAAASHLQPTKAGTAAVEGAVASGPLVELEPAAAMAIHQLETRLDQLKEIQQWAKIDPDLLRFAERVNTAQSAPVALTPQQSSAARQDTPRRSVLLPLVVGAVALLAGWLLSLAVPAAALLGR